MEPIRLLRLDFLGFTLSTGALFLLGLKIGELTSELSPEIRNLLFLSELLLSLLATAILFSLSFKFLRTPKPPEIESDVRVSVIIPCYNEESVIERCVKSVLSSYYENKEVIIVYEEDCSDRTPEIAKELSKRYENVRALKNEFHRSKAGALNFGVLNSSGEIIGILDADHIISPDVLSRAVSWLSSDRRIGAVDGSCTVRNRGKGILARIYGNEFSAGLDISRFIEELFSGSHLVYGSNVFIRRDVLEEIGGFDPSSIGEDKEISLRLLQRGYRTLLDLGMISMELSPVNIEDWWNQRKRWDRTRFQLIRKYMSLLRKRGRFKFVGLPILFLQAIAYPMGILYTAHLLASLMLFPQQFFIMILPFFPLSLIYVMRALRDVRLGCADWKDIILSSVIPLHILTRAFTGFKAFWEEITCARAAWRKISRVE
ncbi:MAG: glycosyltransferase family 2 protein [Archaeoglobi archaeon]|nr:glycosyltransferase family 2 protein [Candidatus Mnemosynella sp.]